MDDSHQKATQLDGLAAHAHRAAAEHNDKKDHLTGGERSRQGFEHSDRAYEQEKETHNKSGRLETSDSSVEQD